MVEPEMLDHVLIPPNWKEFVFHRGCSFNLTSILSAELIAGGREGRRRRRKKKNSIVMISRTPEKFTTKQVGSTLKTLFVGTIFGRAQAKGKQHGAC